MNPLVGAAIGQVGGGIVGSVLGGDDRRKAERKRRAAIAAIEQAQAEMGPSAFGELGNDPLLVNRQLQALEAMRGVYESGGMDAQARAQQAEAMQRTAAAERGTRGALAQNFAMRGAGGSGVELAAQLTNQQGAANRNAQAGTQAAGGAAQRAIQAMLGTAGMAGNLRGQEMQKAGGLDAVSRFNADQRLRKAGMLANANLGAASANDAEAQRQTNFGAGLGAAAGAGASMLFGGNGEDTDPERYYFPEEIR